MGLRSFFKLVADRRVLPSETDVGTFLAANPDHSVHVDLLERYEHLREKLSDRSLNSSSSHEAHPEGPSRSPHPERPGQESAGNRPCLCLRFCILVRPLPHRRRKFEVYGVNSVIQALNLPSHEHLVLFCAIAGNDYSRNPETLGSINNLRLVRKVAWNKSYNKMLQDYLREASKMLGRNAASEEGHFRVALRVFTSGYQTSAQALPSNNEFDNFKQRLLNGRGLRHRMAQQRDAPSFYIAEGSHRNQFRPIFSDKASILNGRTVDISNCRQHDRPGLKHPPRRKKTKKKQQKKQKRKHKGKKPHRVKKEGEPIRNLKDATKVDYSYSKERDNIASQIRGAVVILNRLRRYAYWAIALDIERIMRLPGAARSRKKALDEVLDSTDYSFRPATLLLSDQGGPNSAYARAKKQGRAVETPHYLLAYEHFKATTELSPIKEIDITLGDVQGFDPKKTSFPRATELLMGQVQPSLRQHYRNAMHALVGILWANEDTKQLLERILPLNNPSKTAMFECVQGTKGFLIQALFCDIGGDGYRDKTKRQRQSDVDEEDPSQELGLSQGFLDTTCSKAAAEGLTDEG
ncbi:hypothetical protein BCR41DRAFT_392351 [Lobosporangium transversale]|uniref:Uncharacterized protein n=1 Tax=Lobosporangium transversale TaxID=64571 RepID=A0A1Y2H2F3_9FUNG|nr:hypothetical protein BCR41DRAFT_392351 [Lobosporangium transversale]ORZ27893.1 hypothetical protein BCR41DRAFT_392351 [Lobosporangium transversale]|eukprot:XP_021885596.1 hypothetical protein BCR41DRAFT_392351 [Lobosporangium transversale]